MQTEIRKGKTLFFGDKVFPHGLSRSGNFNKRESMELEIYGATFDALTNGTLMPENEEEQQFVLQINTGTPDAIYSVKLWQKYLNAVAKSKVHHGFAKSSQREMPPIHETTQDSTLDTL
ncbi:hypothetical protein tinsulaeT_15810 [Thalassotalea insulae]|uniref:Macrodomain Ori protein n=1 Tax=Thalassotalea insulae TaxID=2056778 RepID=A0ABQ6GU68_9GAMM|nr:DUF413 domain-containing protein [Thalassotalea insulae]GLX78241.1 hypothetical protein tinsulaeT_15810 [Thalassotalea insulae]